MYIMYMHGLGACQDWDTLTPFLWITYSKYLCTRMILGPWVPPSVSPPPFAEVDRTAGVGELSEAIWG